MTAIALVTAKEARGLDEDMPPLVAAFRKAGVEPAEVDWDDPSVRWAEFPLVIIRSTWDYVPRRNEFLGWAERVGSVTHLVNPPAILRWNTDKRYLRELGGSVVPTSFIEPKDPIELPAGVDFVVKPAISAGSIDTARYRAGDVEPARDHVKRLQAQGRTVMVQPYQRAIDEAGETALVYIAGEYSHSIRKGPILGGKIELVEGLYAKEDIQAREATTAEREVGDEIIAQAPGPLLYARVDLVPGESGRPILLEFEATEPSLFFKFDPGAADRFVQAALRFL
jgi:glutathione synthase/RimK-type ligase-like ATP-grasp enzyme